MGDKIIPVVKGSSFDAIVNGDIVMLSLIAWDEYKPFVQDVAVGDLIKFTFDDRKCIVGIQEIYKKKIEDVTEEELRMHNKSPDDYLAMVARDAGMSGIKDVWIIRFARVVIDKRGESIDEDKFNNER